MTELNRAPRLRDNHPRGVKRLGQWGLGEKESGVPACFMELCHDETVKSLQRWSFVCLRRSGKSDHDMCKDNRLKQMMIEVRISHDQQGRVLL